MTLSGGEKLRISVARALSKNAPTVLIGEGRVCKQGTHTELMARGGLCARLWNIQDIDGIRNPGYFLRNWFNPFS